MSRGKRFESARRLSFVLICRENAEQCKGASIRLEPIYCNPFDRREHKRTVPLGSFTIKMTWRCVGGMGVWTG